MSQPRNRTTPASRRRARSALFAAALTTILVGSAGGPAFALDGPVANDDAFDSNGRGVVTGNVLTNDKWDKAHTAALTAVHLRKHFYGTYDAQYVNCDDQTFPAPTVTFTAAGNVAVDFGTFDCAGEPSIPRTATLDYEFADSAGQMATGHVTVSEYRSTVPMVAVNDTLPAPVPEGEWSRLPEYATEDSAFGSAGGRALVFQNDLFGKPGQYSVEIVDQPTKGKFASASKSVATNLAMDYVPNAPAEWESVQSIGGGAVKYTGAEVTDTFTYRLRLKTNPAVVSNVATVNLTYLPIKYGTPATASRTEHFYEGGVNGYTFTPKAPADVDVSGLTLGVYEADGTAPRTGYSLTENGDGTYTFRWDDDADTSTRRVARDLFVWYDGTPENRVAQTSYSWTWAPLVTATPEDDEVWVRVGGDTKIPLLLNDKLANQQDGGWFGMQQPDSQDGFPANAWSGFNWLQSLGAPSLGSFTGWSDLWAGTSGSGQEQSRLHYTAGNVSGDDVVNYRLCAGMPTDAACGSATLTIHVSPDVAATDDTVDADAGTSVNVPVLDNDTYTDKPTSAAEVTVLNVPAGVTADVKDDRTVTVTAGPEFAGRTVKVVYRLADFTGSSDATVAVKFAGAAVGTAPDAVDDTTTMVAGTPVTIPVLDNDTYEGTPRVVARLTADAGYTVTTTADGELVVNTLPGFTGDEVVLGYVLIDGNGDDQATVRVRVEQPVAPADPPAVDPSDEPTPAVPPVADPTPSDPPVPTQPRTPTTPGPQHPRTPPTVPAGGIFATAVDRTTENPVLPVGMLVLITGAGALLLRRRRQGDGG